MLNSSDKRLLYIQYLEEVSQLPPAISWASSTEELMLHQPLSNHDTYNPNLQLAASTRQQVMSSAEWGR